MAVNTPEKYFLHQLYAHQCQLPPSEDYQAVQKVSRMKNWCLISERSLKSYLKAKSLAGIYFEKRRQLRTTKRIIHPYSDLQHAYTIWMTFFLLFTVVLLPFFAAFHGPVYAKQVYSVNGSYHNFWRVLYVVTVVHLLCFVDLIVNFFLGYGKDSSQEMVIQPSKIIRHYFFTFFIVDLTSSIPIDFLLVMSLGMKNYVSLNKTQVLFLSVVPFVKLTRLPQLHDSFWVLFSNFSSSPALFRAFWVTALFFLFVHWCTCISVLVPQFIYFDDLFIEGMHSLNSSWIFTTGYYNRTLSVKYIAASYRTISCITRLGFELNHTSGMEDEIITVIFGSLGNVYILVMVVIFIQATSSRTKPKFYFKEIIEQVNEYMEHKKFPKKLRKKVREYYMWYFQRNYIKERAILSMTSDTLRKDLLFHIYQRLIEKVNLLSGSSETLVIQILSRLKPEIYQEQEVIFKYGDFPDCIYFISFGTVAMYRKDGLEVLHLDDGDYFGDVSVYHGIYRYATIIALETTLLYRFDAKDFEEIIRPDKSLLRTFDRKAEVLNKLLQAKFENVKIDNDAKSQRYGSGNQDDETEEN